MPYNSYTTLNTYCGTNCGTNSAIDPNDKKFSRLIDNNVYEGFSPGFSPIGVL